MSDELLSPIQFTIYSSRGPQTFAGTLAEVAAIASPEIDDLTAKGIPFTVFGGKPVEIPGTNGLTTLDTTPFSASTIAAIAETPGPLREMEKTVLVLSGMASHNDFT